MSALTERGAPVGGVAWEDELRLGLHGVVRRQWASWGVALVQMVDLRYGWCYLVLGVDGQGGRLWWAWTTSMRGVALAPVLGAWRVAGVEALMSDDTASRRGRVVRAVALPRVVQPPGSPELNPGERVFDEVRRAVKGRGERLSWLPSLPSPTVSAPSPRHTGFVSRSVNRQWGVRDYSSLGACLSNGSEGGAETRWRAAAVHRRPNARRSGCGGA